MHCPTLNTATNNNPRNLFQYCERIVDELYSQSEMIELRYTVIYCCLGGGSMRTHQDIAQTVDRVSFQIGQAVERTLRNGIPKSTVEPSA
jgi:hypothetical protein